MDLNDFAQYEKIVESSDRWGLDAADWRLLRRTDWCVTEKIHGANFVFVADDDTVRCANRKAFLEEDEPFFGYERIRDTVADAVRAAFTRLKANRPALTRLFVYGELFGGGYPYPDVPAVAGVQPVQTGVWYTPDIQFLGFDLRLETPEGSRYLDYEEALRIGAAVNLPLSQPLFVGNYAKALDYPVRFDSTIPARLGLPSLPTGTNLAEGIVLKPVRELALPVRPILKRKIVEFAEDKRFHESEKWTSPEPTPGGALDLLKWEAYCLLTENRWQASLSKVGTHRREEALALFVAEVLEEAAAALPDRWGELPLPERDALKAFVQTEAARLATV